jgi:hypothetical protein
MLGCVSTSLHIAGRDVGRADAIALLMGELQLNERMFEPVLMQCSGRNAPEAVACHPALVAHPLKCLQQSVVGHRALVISFPRKDVRRQAPQFLQAAQNVDRLTRERHNVGCPHLHSLGGNPPFRCVKIELVPLRLDELRRSDERLRDKL